MADDVGVSSNKKVTWILIMLMSHC